MTKNSERSLAQQLRITEADIRQRKELLGLTTAGERALGAFRATAERLVDGIVAEFYAYQVTIPSVETIIGDADTLGRLKSAMRGYVLELFGGDYGSSYVNARLRIGKVHARIGVSPKLYVSSLHHLELAVRRHATDHGATPELMDTLHKLFLFDLQLVFDTYIQGLVSQVELGRDQVSAYAETLEEKVAERTAEIARVARTDSVTGLWNRHEFYDRLRDRANKVNFRLGGLTLVFFDIDDFKAVNDTRGHVEGDRVLLDVGTALAATARAGDLAFRYGGDEFCLMLPDTCDTVARLLCDALEELLPDDIKLSFGIAALEPGDADNLDKLVARADAAMYQTKAARRADERRA